ncbi:hypothetical protein GX51_02695 [Blastomyces parvus]|uniref:Uncharacterized protein n=1 Tax=Blastomyces parvus TaxID=2060905 RepID=A0A2B7X2P2_9EURO|nr:hypothetical protein GX51_02695 [Blastomyces parvus]
MNTAFAISVPPPPRTHFEDGAVVEELINDQTGTGRCHIRKFTAKPPASPGGRVISKLPPLRRIIWRRRKDNHEFHARPINSPANREAVLIQTRGQRVYSCDDMCARCQLGLGPFTTCVVARTSDEESPRSGACANCVWRNCPGKCSLRRSIKGDTRGDDTEWQYESSDDDDEEEEEEKEDDDDDEPALPTPSRSPRSRGTTPRANKAAVKKPSKRDSRSNSRSTRSKAPKPKPTASTTPRAKRPPVPAVVIPSPLKRKPVTPASQKYFKIPPRLSPNTVEDIRRAIDELNEIRTRLFSRLERLEAVQLVDWE